LALWLAIEGSAHAGGKAVDGVVNLNTAAPELLAALPGIGPSKAIGIVAYRNRHPFRTVDELVRVKGIGRNMVRAMRAHLAVAGPSTAHPVAGAARFELPPPAPPPAPVRPPLLCRPVAPLALPAAALRITRLAQARPVRTGANHCSPPP
jgi:competence ComEA-like helix-hairpin-helix protein